MTLDATFHVAGVACLAVMAGCGAHALLFDFWRHRHRILAAPRGEPAALGDPAPRVTAGNPLHVDRADLEQPARPHDRIAADAMLSAREQAA